MNRRGILKALGIGAGVAVTGGAIVGSGAKGASDVCYPLPTEAARAFDDAAFVRFPSPADWDRASVTWRPDWSPSSTETR
jgi:hypothetical protein